MSTATIERDRVVSQPSREVVYTARRSDLQLIKVPRRDLRGASGEKVGETEGITVEFLGGMLRLPEEGSVRTKHGVDIDVTELHPWLQGHRLYGDLHEGFVKVEQSAPPVTSAEIEALTEASLTLDEEALLALIHQEETGWNREQLLSPARKALAAVRAAAAQVEAEKSKPGPKKAQG